MNKPILSVRPHANDYSLVHSIGTEEEYVVAARIPREALAKKFAAVPELIDAAIFAASVIKSNGMYELSERLAYQRLEEAVIAAGHEIDTPAIRAMKGVPA